MPVMQKPMKKMTISTAAGVGGFVLLVEEYASESNESLLFIRVLPSADISRSDGKRLAR